MKNLNYLGRSESWVEAELWNGPVEGKLCDVVEHMDAPGELATVACAVPAAEYNGKTSWMDALTFSTSDLLKQRASSPPLLRQLRYVRPIGAIETDPPHKPRRISQQVQCVLLSLDATVLPLVTTSLEVAEQIRVRLMGAHKRRMDGDETRVSPVFSGKTPNGEKRMDHGHVYILPQGNDKGRIDRVLIWSPLRAFREDELDAVRGVRKLWQRDDRGEVQCVITWQGARDDLIARTPSKFVESATPFVPPRHWRKGRDFERFIRDEVRRECRNHNVGNEPDGIELRDHMPGLFDAVEYRRNRKSDPVRPGYALRLTFSNKVLAPFSIGYGAHFGLGQFRPE